MTLRIFRDGSRTIVVFENCSPSTDQIITSVLTGIAGESLPAETIPDILPPIVEEVEAPVLPMEEVHHIMDEPPYTVQSAMEALRSDGRAACETIVSAFANTNHTNKAEVIALVKNFIREDIEYVRNNEMAAEDMILFTNAYVRFIKKAIKQMLNMTGFPNYNEIYLFGDAELIADFKESTCKALEAAMS